MEQVTEMLELIGRGDGRAADALLPLLYNELRVLASDRLAREKPGQTLQPTALVHEAYLRLVRGGSEVGWDSRGHFFAAAAEAMRRILIDRAREKQALKRGGDQGREPLEAAELAVPVPDEQLLEINDALEQLEKTEPVTAEVVKLRFFAGLTLEEVASALGVSTRTVSKHWAFARASLLQLLDDAT